MKRFLLSLVALALLTCSVEAAVGVIYADTGGCETGSTTKCSGTTDSASASAKGSGSTITCSATSGPASAPGCIITGTGSAAGQLGSIAVDGSQAVFVDCATNTNQKIFWINAVDDGTGAIGTTQTPTGCTAATSDWGIGGRYIWPGGSNHPLVVNALRAGDTIQFNNTPATKSTTPYISASVSGDATTGKINIIGKSGVRPVLEQTGNQSIITAGSTFNYRISNLELKISATSSSNAAITINTGWVIDNVYIHTTGATPTTAQHGISSNNIGYSITNSEIGPVGGSGLFLATNSGSGVVSGNYIHGAGVDCITLTGTVPNHSITGNVLSTCAGRGIYLSGASTTQNGIVSVYGNTIYNNATAGLEVADADTPVSIRNNIFQNDGSHANIVYPAAGPLSTTHAYNVFYASAGTNLTNFTANSTESTSNPNFTNAASGDFSINSTSSAANAGFMGTLPISGGSVGYKDLGAIQRNGNGASGGSIIGG